MGFGGISLTQLLVILAIVVLVFGTKRVKSLGSDLGGAIKGFRKAMDADDDTSRSQTDDPERLPRIEPIKDPKSDAELAEHTRHAKHV